MKNFVELDERQLAVIERLVSQVLCDDPRSWGMTPEEADELLSELERAKGRSLLWQPETTNRDAR